MRVCPKCGYRDPPYWRPARHRYISDICHITDLDVNEPELAKKVRVFGRAPNYYCDGKYYYRLTASNTVERTERDDFHGLQKGHYERGRWPIRAIEPRVCHKLDEWL